MFTIEKMNDRIHPSIDMCSVSTVMPLLPCPAERRKENGLPPPLAYGWTTRGGISNKDMIN